MKYEEFQKQYLFTFRLTPKIPDGWETIAFGEWNLIFDKRLNFSILSRGNIELAILGFAININDSALNELEILERLLENEANFLDELDTLCGVFIIIKISSGQIESIFHDACGIMRVNYLINSLGTLVAIGFDTSLISMNHELKLKDDLSAVNFYKSKKYNESGIELGSQTKYINLFQLLPNHYLCFKTRKAVRYFPRKPLDRISLKEGVDRSSAYMSNILKGFNRKFERNILSITAGWDSRVVLAANKYNNKKNKYFLFHKSDLGGYLVDLKISKQIAEYMKLDFQIFDIRGPKEIGLEKVLKSSIADISNQNIENLINGVSHFNPSDILILGFLSEITKVYFGSFNVNNGLEFTFISKFPNIEYCKTYFNKYIENNKLEIEKMGYNFNDIAHWEQDAFNYAAKRMAIYNTYTSAISPFNNRLVINSILGVDEKYRGDFKNKFFRRFIRTNWPELLDFPINPVIIKYWIITKKFFGISAFMKRLEFYRYKFKIGEYRKTKLNKS